MGGGSRGQGLLCQIEPGHKPFQARFYLQQHDLTIFRLVACQVGLPLDKALSVLWAGGRVDDQLAVEHCSAEGFGPVQMEKPGEGEGEPIHEGVGGGIDELVGRDGPKEHE